MVGALVAQHKLTSERYAAGIPQFLHTSILSAGRLSHIAFG